MTSEEQKAKKPPYGDLASSLSGAQRAAADALVALLEREGLTPKWHGDMTYSAKLKGKVVLRFCMLDGLSVFLTLAPRDRLEDALSALPEDMREFYLAHIRPCRRCSPGHIGRKITLFGEERRYCAAPELKIENPGPGQMEMLSRFVAERKRFILEN